MLNNKSILITGGTGSFGKRSLKLFLIDINTKNLSNTTVINSNNLKCNKSDIISNVIKLKKRSA